MAVTDPVPVHGGSWESPEGSPWGPVGRWSPLSSSGGRPGHGDLAERPPLGSANAQRRPLDEFQKYSHFKNTAKCPPSLRVTVGGAPAHRTLACDLPDFCATPGLHGSPPSLPFFSSTWQWSAAERAHAEHGSLPRSPLRPPAVTPVLFTMKPGKSLRAAVLPRRPLPSLCYPLSGPIDYCYSLPSLPRLGSEKTFSLWFFGIGFLYLA